MPAKRIKAKNKRAVLSAELRPLAERLFELEQAHRRAISTGEDKFYGDGRHEELCHLTPIINQALGIKPWDDEEAILREALGAGAGGTDAATIRIANVSINVKGTL